MGRIHTTILWGVFAGDRWIPSQMVTNAESISMSWHHHVMCVTVWTHLICINTLRPRQNGRHFSDDTFKRMFLNENIRISIKISLNFVPKSPIDNIPALVQIMAWRRPGDKPLSEPMMVSLLTHICVTRPQWVKTPWKEIIFPWSMITTFSYRVLSFNKRRVNRYKIE